MRATRDCWAAQSEKPWHTCFMPGPSGFSSGCAAKRAWLASCPGISRCVLQGSSDSVARANSWISLTVALSGMVAHRVTVLASASEQGVVGGGAASADTPGGVVLPGGFTTSAGRQVDTLAM